jgi:hypothetical protein
MRIRSCPSFASRWLQCLAVLVFLWVGTGSPAAAVLQTQGPDQSAVDSPQPGESDVLSLAFGWTAGTKARVVSRIRRNRLRDGVTDSTEIVSTYQLECVEHPEGLRVDYHGFALVDEEADDSTSLTESERLAQLASTMMPSLVLSTDGELLRVEGIEAIQDGLERLLEPIREGDPEIAIALSELFARAISKEALESRVSEQWSALVGFWSRAELELGVTYEMESESKHPLFPGTMLPFRFRFWAETRTACAENGDPAACVELRMVSFPDPDVLRGILDQMVGPPGSATYEELHVENSVRLLTEPESLLPHRIDVLRTTWGTIRTPGEPPMPFEQNQVRSTAYFYGE